MPLSTPDILQGLLPLRPDSFKENFIGIFVSTLDGPATHAGLIISYEGTLFSYHYDSEKVAHNQTSTDTENANVYIKKLDILDKRLIPSFLQHCNRIAKEAKPLYGMFYRGEYYQDGVYYTNTGFPELMTCVGFCLNVINGFIDEDKYLEFEDWIPVSEQAELYFLKFIKEFKDKHPELDVTELRKSLRRIKPSELFASAYFTDLPIRKADTDPVDKILVEYWSNRSSSKAS